MSSNEDDSYESEPTAKQKRVQRACDMCRKKKRRCDGSDKCDHCRKHNFICTYVEPPTARPALGARGSRLQISSSSSKSEIEALENRLKTVEALLEKSKAERSPGVQLISNAIRRLNSPFPEPHADDLTFTDVADSFRFLSIDDTTAQGFQGKSSGAMLVKAAVDLQNGRTKSPASTDFGHLSSIHDTSESTAIPAYDFPDNDLLQSLIQLYFSNVNPFLPLLHRPTFGNAVNRRFHLTHGGFAKTVLLVCAVGARYSTDPRVSIPDTPLRETAGWKWFDQVKLSGHMVHSHPTLYDLQSYCLAAMFLDCTSSPRTCWTLVGFGMRLGQDIGAHRYRKRHTLPTFEQELEKRASWVLFLFDIQISTALGRCIALQSHDFDIELPFIVDDEYWSGPDPSAGALFVQPAGKPSQLEFFKCMLNLSRILSFSCKILYSTNRSKTLIGLGDDKWEEQVVVELDSALNTWFETIPPHLRWDPDTPIEDDTFFDQSAALHCVYFSTRIIIHRPFIPAMRRASPTHLPSLAICNTAARACSHVAHIQQQRRPNNPIWFSQTPLFTSGIVLLLNIWGGSGPGNGAGRTQAAEKDLADVHRCMAVLSAQRQQWPSAGALLDTLRQLVAVDHPLPSAQTSSSVLPAPPTVPWSPYTSTHGMDPLPSTNTANHDYPTPLPTPPNLDAGLNIHTYTPLPIPPNLAHAVPPLDMAFTTYADPGPNPTSFAAPLSPPMYDPALETAPPDDYLEADTWYEPNNADHDQMPAFDGYMAPGENMGSYGLPSSNSNSNLNYSGFGFPGGGVHTRPNFGDGDMYAGEDFVMEGVDMQTIALWSQAPTSFGVADWDMYLGQFVEDMQPVPIQVYPQS